MLFRTVVGEEYNYQSKDDSTTNQTVSSPAQPSPNSPRQRCRSWEGRGAKNLADDGRLPNGILTLAIGAFNTRTLARDHQIDFLLRELSNINLDILAVCETKRKNGLTARWQDGSQIFLGAAGNNAKIGRVGFI